MTGVWRDYRVSDDATHHTVAGRPAYPARFTEVLKFHEPGLAPVIDAAGAYHILPDGSPAYPERYTRTFGFYEGRAAAQAHDGWLHILPEGKQLYRNRYLWCGNFQGGHCTVRDDEGRYFHIDQEGMRAYDAMYRYTGDFRDASRWCSERTGATPTSTGRDLTCMASGISIWTYITRASHALATQSGGIT